MIPPVVDVKKAVGFVYPTEKYTYELDKNFAAFPTYPLVLPLKGATSDINSYAERSKGVPIPGVPEINLNRLVHGEQYLEILAPIPLEGTFKLEGVLSGVYDAGKGMIMDRESIVVDESGKAIVKMVSSTFIIGAGGWGGPHKPKPTNVVAPPKREPDAVQEDTTTTHQALLYRLSGDYNPLHVDPSIGARLGMKGVILHGLCTFGISAGAVLRNFGNDDPTVFKSIYGRFASPVYPGETLQTVMWKVKEEAGLVTVAYITKVKERNVVVIGNGTVILHSSALEESKAKI
ncbi:HotDog domain-containing protein [Blyttiomyces helicus]|uniref:HotDog domain-containing protein n=1 Tax=Blyttiomyces helicus TaxID=388810 RepID=A0A4V1IQU9_9FUNG|nr:HotDog domain-containing protein [Blyttiomyces helicus]|eukprot:RKO87817.1 HotDog domain-containing protein [Blyttiomyces helicus]